MKILKYALFFAGCVCYTGLSAIQLDDCQQKARENYPLVKQFSLLDKSRDFNLNNANKSWFPQATLNVKATYQSEVTEIPAAFGEILSNITGRTIEFQSLTRDQYQAVVDVSQTIWDGGAITNQKKLIKQTAEIDKQKLEVDLYALRERINQLYFGVLMLDKQLHQLQLFLGDLNENHKKVKVLKQNGVAQQTDVDALEVEVLNALQRETELKSVRKNYLQVLSAFIGKQIDENEEFDQPVMPEIVKDAEILRPEMYLFAAQQQLLSVKKSSVHQSLQPKIGAFVQGGYGRPGLNMFTNAFSPFYIGGIRFSWNLSSFYTKKDNLNQINVSKQMIDNQMETFVFNNKLQQLQQINETDKLKIQIKRDEEIIRLRENINKATEARVQNGTSTYTDLLREMNALENARNQQAVHEIQLLLTATQYQFTINR